MSTEPEAMREIHAIRERLHERTQNMTPEEHAAFYRRQAEELLKKCKIGIHRAAVPETASSSH